MERWPYIQSASKHNNPFTKKLRSLTPYLDQWSNNNSSSIANLLWTCECCYQLSYIVVTGDKFRSRSQLLLYAIQKLRVTVIVLFAHLNPLQVAVLLFADKLSRIVQQEDSEVAVV